MYFNETLSIHYMIKVRMRDSQLFSLFIDAPRSSSSSSSSVSTISGSSSSAKSSRTCGIMIHRKSQQPVWIQIRTDI